MKKTIVAAIFLLIALIAAIPAQACEPCQEILTLEESAAQADLIIVGALVSEGPDNGSGPDWITVQVIESWKGTPPSDQIRVNSRDGMCLYGIPNEQGQYLMLLQASDDQYVTVGYGCAMTHYTLDTTNQQIIVDDQPVPYDDFIARLGPDVERTIISEPSFQGGDMIPPLWLVIAVAAAFLLIIGGITLIVVLIVRKGQML